MEWMNGRKGWYWTPGWVFILWMKEKNRCMVGKDDTGHLDEFAYYGWKKGGMNGGEIWYLPPGWVCLVWMKERKECSPGWICIVWYGWKKGMNEWLGRMKLTTDEYA